jgi:predicted dehydrogenase
MKEKYGVVLVGCGYMGAAHMDEIYYRDNIEIRGVVDIEADKARTFAKRYGSLSWRLSYKEYLKDPDADIFIIATYPSTHLGILRDCLQNGKHVLCEKPICATLEDAKEFTRLVKQSKQKVLIGHILRHNCTYNKVAEMIHEGAIGSPVIIRMVQNKHIKDWDRYLQLINNTSPIIDCGVHYIDVMEWFTGSKIISVSGISLRTDAEVLQDKYNYGVFCARLANGSVAYYESGWGNTIASEDIKEFIGPKGRIKIIYRKDRNTHQEEGDLIEYYSYPGNEYKIINIDAQRKPTWSQLQYLIKMIEEDVDAKPTIDEVYNAFKIALAADEALTTGKTIEFKL